MLEKIAAFLLAVAGPLLAYVLRSRRKHRLQGQVTDYLKLADELEASDPSSAKRLRELVTELVQALVEAERQSLGRRFEPMTFIAGSLFLLPAGIALVLIWPVDTAWKWLATAAVAVWTLIVLVAAWQTGWKSEAEQRASSA